VKAQVTCLHRAAVREAGRAGVVVAEKSDVDPDLNRDAGPARKASQKTSTSDDEEW
jgi:hypothetical protein